MMCPHPNWSHPDHDACGTGLLAQLRGAPSYELVRMSLTALERLTHRGGVDADGASGDGAGLLTSLPIEFLRKAAEHEGIRLPELFGVGMVFVPEASEQGVRAAVEVAARAEQIRVVGWRRVPTDPSTIGPRALATMPRIWQFFVAPSRAARGAARFETRLTSLRKRAELLSPKGTYFCSVSSRMVVYKGLLTPWQLPKFYADLRDERFKISFSIFHQRYSTNTRPSWQLAQPFRYTAHNGEINTIVSNRRWIAARGAQIRERLGVGEWFGLLEQGASDSASFDNGFELRIRQGQSAEDTMLAMVPPVFEKDPTLSDAAKRGLEALYLQGEPWDGPAALIFTDGTFLGAKLDRNGLRPLRYTRTRDGLVVVGSETGLVDLDESRIAERQRLGPGEMVLVNPSAGLFCNWRQVVDRVARRSSKTKPAKAQHVAPAISRAADPPAEPKRAAASFGWTEDQFRILFTALTKGKEADWSMGDDAPPAFLSGLHRTLWDYCKQRFAQVTNPAIDPLRETQVMSLEIRLGDAVLRSPLIGPEQLEELTKILGRVQRIDFTFSAKDGITGAREALAKIAAEPLGSDARPDMILLTDRRIGEERAALPALLAAAAAWKSMVREGLCDVPLVVETGQAFDTHHIAMLLAIGASCVHPYLALHFAERDAPGGGEKVRTAVDAGMRKVLARMGVSTLASYRNGRLFEVVGLGQEICSEYFEDVADYLDQKTLDGLLGEYLWMHAAAYSGESDDLTDSGLYRFRKGGELHGTSPDVVRRMHAHVRKPTNESYAFFEELAAQSPVAVRDMLELVPTTPIAIEEVEPQEEIMRRFSTQAMSLGALSPEAHKTLAIAMNAIGGRSNTGEGGEDNLLYTNEPEAANKIKQVASGRFGVTTEYLVHAEEIEIKMAQGSKPGEGGQLPAKKVSDYIARIRHAVPGMQLISPPPHHDIYSIEDLAQLIHDLKAVNPRARVGVKLVSGAGVGVITAGVAKAGADVITISGHSGGTGSSPLTSIKNTGLPWEIGLHDAHETLIRMGLRSRVTLRTDGGFKFARDILVAAVLGADEFGFGTSSLLAMGCIMARQCHLNTCPVGIATQDEGLRAKFTGKPEMVVAYFRSLAEEVRANLARLGAKTLHELVGAEGRLRPKSEQDAPWLEILLAPPPETLAEAQKHAKVSHGLDLAHRLAKLAVPTGETQTISNSDRSIGAHLSGELERGALNVDTNATPLEYEFRGAAGQSFGAWLVPGVTLRLTGEANDYVGKGLCGGVVAVNSGSAAARRGDVLVGNTCLYGATAGRLFVAGRGGERFAVRNSGALAVVEGVGQHGCEYMTSGVAVILGSIGLNFGSGMTGGLAYLMPAHAKDKLNREFVTLVPLEAFEEEQLRAVLAEHVRLTRSPCGAQILRGAALPFWRVQPKQLPCSIERTWEPILAGMATHPKVVSVAASQVSQTALGN